MDKLKSRKLWVSIVSAILVVLNDGLGLNIDNETVMQFTILIVGYVFTQGIVDAVQGNKEKTVENKVNAVLKGVIGKKGA